MEGLTQRTNFIGREGGDLVLVDEEADDKQAIEHAPETRRQHSEIEVIDGDEGGDFWQCQHDKHGIAGRERLARAGVACIDNRRRLFGPAGFDHPRHGDGTDGGGVGHRVARYQTKQGAA